MCDSDSLFGSPPSSPKRDRTPSLALPESSGWSMDEQIESQNVGTIALPGSHNHSELVVSVKPALPNKNNVLQVRPSGLHVSTRSTQATPLVGKPPMLKNGVLQLKPSSVQLHQDTRLLERTLHNERMDRTLRDLIGLVSNFESIARSPANSSAVSIPVTPAPSMSAPLGSAENPIEIEDKTSPADEVSNALIALASTVTSALKIPEVTSTPSSNTNATINNVLCYVKADPKLIPSLKATCEYLACINEGSSRTPVEPSNFKKRLPQQEGTYISGPAQSPSDNPVKWQIKWGRQILGELLGLFERGFAKARALSCTGPSREHSSEPATKKQKVGHEDLRSVDEYSGVGSQRMVQWLSSVPSTVVEPTIVDSTNTDKLASMPSCDDFFAGFGDVLGPFEPMTTEDVAKYNLLFDGTPIEGIDLGLQPDSSFQPFMGSPQSPNVPHNCDPSLSPPDQFTENLSFDDNLDGENRAQRQSVPLLFSKDVSLPERQGMTCLEESTDHTDNQSVGAQTFYTMPTGSGASSHGGVSPFQRVFSPSPSLDASYTSAANIPEKQTVTLAKAKVHREHLLQELERIRSKRWELLIESGVLRNLEKITENPV